MKFCPSTRGHYNDVDQMREDMITKWNDIVQSEDIVYMLGDIAFLPSSEAVKIMNRLNGKKILIAGNHDRKLLKDPVFRRCFEEIHTYLEITYEKTPIVMFHYPIFDHNGAHRGSIMLHGHRHGNPHNIPGKIMDVGFDSTGNIVTDLEDIIKTMENVPHMYYNRHPEKT
jgi:calcineurin-like phosphoesterase family protein